MSRSIPSVPWGPREALIVFGATWIGFPFLLVLTLRQLAGIWPQAGIWLHLILDEHVLANFFLSLVVTLLALLLVVYFVRKSGAGLAQLGLRGFNPFKALLIVALVYIGFAVLLAVAFELIQLLYPAFNPDEPQVNEFTSPDTTQALRLSLVALVFLPALMEEIAFRGFIFPAFMSRFGVIGAAITSSALFGIAHLQLNVVVYTFILGLLLCYMYRRLGSIWPGIILHAVNNYIAFREIINL